MVDHMLARCTWAARLGADDIAEAHGVERALHGADVRLQAHHVYLAASNRSRRNSCKPNTGAVAFNLVDSTSCKHAQRASLHLRTRQIAAWLCNRTQLCFQGRAKAVCCHAVRHIRKGAWAVEYVRTFPPDIQPALVHAYQRSYPETAAKLTQQHVRWLREYEAELAGRDLPDAMHCLYTRAANYVYRKAGSRPAPCAFWGSLRSLCCFLCQPWATGMHACAVISHSATCIVRHIKMWHLPIIDLQSYSASAWALCSNDVSQQCCPAAQRCSCAVPSRVEGLKVLAYLGERVSRSKTPVVDALLVLYPALAAALTLHPVQLFCAQELYVLSFKDMPLRVHYLYNRWRVCGRNMVKRQAADGQLNKSGVPACALWVCALVTADAS